MQSWGQVPVLKWLGMFVFFFCSDSVMKLKWNSTSEFLFVTETARLEVVLLILTGHVLVDEVENSVLFQK